MRRGPTGAAWLAGLLAVALLVPARAAAADDPFMIDGVTSVATADLDRDGSDEIVVLARDPDGGAIAASAYAFDDGAWRLRASTPLELVDARSGEVRSPRPASDGVMLLEWQQDGRTGVLLVTSQPAETGDVAGAVEHPCCVSVARLRLEEGALRAEPAFDELGSADQLLAVDFEGDGTDEIVASTVDFNDGSTTSVVVLAWGESAFRRVEVDGLGDAAAGSFMALGDTDGQPGREVVFPPAEEDGRFGRLRSNGEGGIVLEVAPLEDAGTEQVWIAGSVQGMLIGQSPRGAEILRWPRGEPITSVRLIEGIEVGGFMPWAGADLPALIAFDSGGPNGIGGPSMVVDVTGQPVAELRATPAVERLLRFTDRDFRAFANAGHALYPFVGMLPGGLPDGTQVYLAGGNAAHFRPDGSIDVVPASALVDVWILGTAGPDGSWAAVTDGSSWIAAGPVAWLSPGPPTGSELRVLPTATLLAPEPGDGLLRPAVTGAVELPPGEDGRARLVTDAEGFVVEIDGPPGSRVIAVRDHSIVRQGVLVGGRPLRVNFVPRARESDVDLDAALLLISPTGQAFGVDWAVDVLRQPPTVSATEATREGRWRAAISGEASLPSSVTVDGQPVAIGEDGAFAAEVDAGPWPRSVEVVARDPLGREAVARVDVVGMVDYRTWPWIPILAAATAAIGLVLFVRTPARRQRPATSVEEGFLEEIDAG